MPYAIEYESKVTGKTQTGPKLMKTIERPLKSVKRCPMTKAEAEDFCDRVNSDPTFSNAYHVVVKI